MTAITEPSLLTVVERNPEICHYYKSHGYTRIWFQAQNGGNNPVDYDFGPCRSAGMLPCVWGVTYAVDDGGNNPRHLSWHDQNVILGQQAVKLKAESVMIDAEDCLKNTRDSQAAKEMIDGVRAGGWPADKPVHLTTLGAPYDPFVDDYGFDLKSFLDTGGGVFIQCYAQLSSSYSPVPSMHYFNTRMNVPKDRLNCMIWTDGRISPDSQVQMIRDGGFDRALSIFLAEDSDSNRDPVFMTLDAVTKLVSTIDARMTLDPRLVKLRDQVKNEISLATAKNPKLWAEQNPKEWLSLQNYLLYRVLFDQEPPPIENYTRALDPPAPSSHIGKAGSSAIQSGAAQSGYLK